MNLEKFIKTAVWLPVFILAGYALPQFLIETNTFYGFMGMFAGIFLWLIIFMIAYLKEDD
jgi:hypothetical protein